MPKLKRIVMKINGKEWYGVMTFVCRSHFVDLSTYFMYYLVVDKETKMDKSMDSH